MDKRVTTRLFDVRKLHITLNDEGQNLKKKHPVWKNAIIKADGLIIISPEYNHGYPGSLKVTLDILLKEYIHKPVALCGVSAGGFGGTRMIEQLVGVVRELGLVATFSDLNISHVQEAFTPGGKLKDKKLDKRIDTFFEELIWMASVLKWGRNNVPSKYHNTK